MGIAGLISIPFGILAAIYHPVGGVRAGHTTGTREYIADLTHATDAVGGGGGRLLYGNGGKKDSAVSRNVS